MTATVKAPKDSKECEKPTDDKKLLENSSHGEDVILEDVTPDGGWGWMVAIGMTMLFIVTMVPGSCFNIIFGDFLLSTGRAGSASTFFNSMFLVSFSFSGLLTNTLMRNYSILPVGVASALLYGLTNTSLAFVQHVYQIGIIFFLQGISLGIMITVGTTTFNAYFLKKRSKVMYMSHMISGMAGIIYPMCIQAMLDTYGFRGTSALVGIVSFHCVFSMLTMHPVEWHTKNKKRLLEKNVPAEKLEYTSEKNNELRFDVGNLAESRRHSTDHIRGYGWSSSVYSLKEGEHEVPLLIEAIKNVHQRTGSHSNDEEAFRPRLKTHSTQDLMKKRMSTLSAASLSSITQVAALGELQNQAMEDVAKISGLKKAQRKSVLNLLADFFEVSLLKDIIFVNIAFGSSMMFSSDIVFSTFVPLMMSTSGYTQSDATSVITIGATAELASKILLALFTMFFEVKARYLFLAASIAMMICKIGFIYCTSLTSIQVMLACIGLTRSWLQAPHPLIMADHFTVEKFPAAYGLSTVITGFMGMISGTFLGFLRDWMGDFVVCQYAMNAMMAFCIVPWIIEILMLNASSRNKKKQEEPK